jgi:hypothetical protein
MHASSTSLRFPVRELPEEKSVIHHIAERTDYRAACAALAPSRPAPGLLALKLPRRLSEGLRSAADEAIRAFGVHGWLSTEGRSGNDRYLSMSLTYNPDLDDPQIQDVHQSTLGTSVNQRSEFYYGATQRFAKLKNTYFDTYGFRLPTPAARIGALGEFLSGCRLSLVRSRLSVLKGEGKACHFGFGWHRDEPVYENLRINIPLRSHRNFRLQLEHQREQPDPASSTMSDHYLAPGKAYTFDTHRPHRVYAAGECTLDRVHLVLGFAPWFRYDAGADAWEPNEFYGKMHPFDIVRSGALHPDLREA